MSWATPITEMTEDDYVTLKDLRDTLEGDAETLRRLTEMITTYDPATQVVVVIPDHGMWAYKCRRIFPSPN
jgi:hypothetical protein